MLLSKNVCIYMPYLIFRKNRISDLGEVQMTSITPEPNHNLIEKKSLSEPFTCAVMIRPCLVRD